MKKIKSFKLFEAVKGLRLEDDIEGMWELFEDIKSIEYIEYLLLVYSYQIFYYQYRF